MTGRTTWDKTCDRAAALAADIDAMTANRKLTGNHCAVEQRGSKVARHGLAHKQLSLLGMPVKFEL